VAGAIFDADKQQYVLGAGVMVDWAPGDIYFGALAARQKALAAGQAVEKVRLDTVREATVAPKKPYSALRLAAAERARDISPTVVDRPAMHSSTDPTTKRQSCSTVMHSIKRSKGGGLLARLIIVDRGKESGAVRLTRADDRHQVERLA
jgi:hypothetical protein